MSARRDEFPLEIMKLWLQIVWADLEIEEAERQKILALANRLGLDEEYIAELKTYLDGQAPLPPPNLGLLRSRKEGVLRSIEDLLGSDGQVSEEDGEVLDQIRMLLG